MITRWDLNELYHEDELYHHGVLGMRWGHRKQETKKVFGRIAKNPSSVPKAMATGAKAIASKNRGNTLTRTIKLRAGTTPSGTVLKTKRSVTVDRSAYNKGRAANAALLGGLSAAYSGFVGYGMSGNVKDALLSAAISGGVGALIGGTKKWNDMRIGQLMANNMNNNEVRRVLKKGNFETSKIDKRLKKNKQILSKWYGVSD